MTHEQREEYIRRAKKAFHSNPNYRDGKDDSSYKTNSYRANSYKTNVYDEREPVNSRTFSFWKIRFVIALILFVAIFSLHQTQSEDAVLSFDKITAMVEKNIDTQAVAAWFEQ